MSPLEILSVLIADGNEEFRRNLSNALQGSYHVSCCSIGEEALKKLKDEAPDILVLDLLLPGLDGISLLHTAAESGICPIVLATTRLINPYIIESAERLCVAYLVQKPCNIAATVSRIRDLSQRIHRSASYAPDPRTMISNILISLGVSTKHRGYVYLREAILLAADEPLQSVTKVIYPTVAGLCGCEPTQVERSIRTAIDSAWKKRDEQIWSQFFQPDSAGVLPHPSNGVFISQLGDRLALNQMRISLPG